MILFSVTRCWHWNDHFWSTHGTSMTWLLTLALGVSNKKWREEIFVLSTWSLPLKQSFKSSHCCKHFIQIVSEISKLCISLFWDFAIANGLVGKSLQTNVFGQCTWAVSFAFKAAASETIPTICYTLFALWSLSWSTNWQCWMQKVHSRKLTELICHVQLSVHCTESCKPFENL